MKNTHSKKKSVKMSVLGGLSHLMKKTIQREKLIGFSFHAPDVLSVSVAGSFNEWTTGSFRLERDRAGVWKGVFPLKPGVYEYRFFVNREWMDDPSAPETVTNAFGTKNAVLKV